MIILFIFLYFFLLLVFWFIAEFVYYFFITPKFRSEPIVYKKYGFFHKLFLDLPRQLGKEFARRDPDSFNASGLIIFTGKQGAGKTISMVEYASTLKSIYPDCKVITNFDCLFSDLHFEGWQTLVDFNNGKLGVCACIDEISLQFHSRAFKDFSPSLIQCITQNRKNRRVILGTAQNLSMVDKQIRLQCTEQRKAFTLFGCLTFVVCSTPIYDSEGNLLRSKFRKIYWFVQSDFLREMYDTYSAVEKMSRFGFVNGVEVND